MSQVVLVLYYSKHGATKAMANAIAMGVEKVGLEARLRCVPEISDNLDKIQDAVPNVGDPYICKQDLVDCCALAMGSPTRFGNMAAPLKYFLDSTSSEWLAGTLENKPACVFTSTSSMHGGQESTLLTMLIPLLHHGMIVCGLPYSLPQLHTTVTGGGPYGVSHLATKGNSNKLSEDEHFLCLEQGKRLAKLAVKLRN